VRAVTILVVDDDDDFRVPFAAALREDGHEVEDLAAPPAASRLDVFGNVGVVVTDYNMTGGNGLSFADRFHAVYPETPIIVVTTDPSRTLEAAIARRAHTMLHRKPSTYAEVVALIQWADAKRMPAPLAR